METKHIVIAAAAVVGTAAVAGAGYYGYKKYQEKKSKKSLTSLANDILQEEQQANAVVVEAKPAAKEDTKKEPVPALSVDSMAKRFFVSLYEGLEQKPIAIDTASIRSKNFSTTGTFRAKVKDADHVAIVALADETHTLVWFEDDIAYGVSNRNNRWKNYLERCNEDGVLKLTNKEIMNFVNGR